MFRLFRVIIRPSNEPTQDYLIPSVHTIIYKVDMYSQYYYTTYCKRYGISECTRN